MKSMKEKKKIFTHKTNFLQKKACVRLEVEYNSPASTQNRKRSGGGKQKADVAQW